MHKEAAHSCSTVPKAVSAVDVLAGLILFAASGLAGCVGPFYQSEARIGGASHQGTGPLTVAQRELEPYSDLERFRQSISYYPYYERETHRTYDGSQLLRDAIVTDGTIDEEVKTRGVPDAIEMNSALLTRWFLLYYKEPAQTYDFRQSVAGGIGSASDPRHHSLLIATLDDVPRSVRRLAFGVGALPPPWPVTITAGLTQSFGVPTLGAPLPAKVDGLGWGYLSKSLSSDVEESNGHDAERAKGLFQKLADANPVAGLDWKIVPFASQIPSGFGVPNGTIFVSNPLIEALKDDELTAVMAHLMGHERYQHYPDNVETAEVMRVQIAPGSIPPAVPKYPEVLTTPPYAYTRWQEIGANRVAIEYLAKLDIPPDVLFDALNKLLSSSSETGFSVDEEWPSFNAVHHTWRTAADLGKLLDTGALNHAAAARRADVR